MSSNVVGDGPYGQLRGRDVVGMQSDPFNDVGVCRTLHAEWIRIAWTVLAEINAIGFEDVVGLNAGFKVRFDHVLVGGVAVFENGAGVERGADLSG